MTRNQLLYHQNRETERSNREKEFETRRSNREKERETRRHNYVTEKENERHNKKSEQGQAIGSALNATGGVLSALMKVL